MRRLSLNEAPFTNDFFSDEAVEMFYGDEEELDKELYGDETSYDGGSRCSSCREGEARVEFNAELDEFLMEAPGRVASFTCSSSERRKIESILGRSVRNSELKAAIDDAAKQGIDWGRNAARALETNPQTATTRKPFFEAFATEPNIVPSWRPSRATWRDFGELIALRLKKAVKILEGGSMEYLCWNACGNPVDPADFHAAIDNPGVHKICLGAGFWESYAASHMAMMASVLVHEALHIHFGSTVIDLSVNTNNAWCYQRFILSFNKQALHPDITINCPIKLRRGDTGLAVRELQNRINRWSAENPGRGLRQRNVDGIFGPNTESDIKVIQRINSLDVDGIVGTNTWKVLPVKRLPVLWRGRPCGPPNHPKVSCTNIMELKFRLNLWLRTQPGHTLLPLDKNFDSKTEEAVKLFQRKHPPLTDDGKVGEQTWKALPSY